MTEGNLEDQTWMKPDIDAKLVFNAILRKERGQYCNGDSRKDISYLEYAVSFFDKAVSEFCDKEHGGFFLYGEGNEQLILRPKETYDGAIPSGNSITAFYEMRRTE